MSDINVFLGGSCNPTTWRSDTAIPALEKEGVSFYNPQVEDWYPELAEIEAKAKTDAELLLFVIDGQTRAIASILEATEAVCTDRHVRLVIEDIIDGTVIDGQTITGRELKDLNRARTYLRELAERRSANTSVFNSVPEAVDAVIFWATR